jgi:Glycosyl transferase family 2
VTIRLALLALSWLELLIWIPPLWRFRKTLAEFCSGLVVLTLVILATDINLWTYLAVFFGIYRLINLRRIIKGRLQPDYLYTTSFQTALSLIGLQVICSLGALVPIAGHGWLLTLTALQLIAGVGFALVTRYNLRSSEGPDRVEPLPDHELPALTVAIPARNETDDLRECLATLVASNYPKLEILVLDDCSQNKRTPEIIRSFAHAGVRFIAGNVPPEHWLAKNYAYEQLAEEANGEILLFCGVDTRFEPGTLRAMVATMRRRKLSMLSWLPQNDMDAKLHAPDSLIQPNRYAWELILPRGWLRRPPVLSTCWLISVEGLAAAGGFKTVVHSPSPESYFARTEAGHNSYAFLRSTPAIRLTSRKPPQEQRDTAIRTRYLQVRRKPALVALVGLAEVTLFASPPLLAVVSLVIGAWLPAVLSLLATVLVASVQANLVRLTYRHFRANSLWQFPLAAIYDAYLLNVSLWRYEFGEVIWKGRNICLPVLRFTADSARKP